MNLHTDNPDLFRAALESTAGRYGFNAELVEKDYFCSQILKYFFSSSSHGLVFKGGTCLNKVYFGFYRLSEDLDFSISVDEDINRQQRSRVMQPIKALFDTLKKTIPSCVVAIPLAGANNSTQYLGEIHYSSALSSDLGKIKVDIGVKEPLLEAPATSNAATLLANPFTGRPMVEPFTLQCLSLQEAMAEKIRAMFTRKEIAIRDFFDFWHARRHTSAPIDDDLLAVMAAKKINTSPFPFTELTPTRRAALERQLLTDLKPVLVEASYRAFDLNAAIADVSIIEEHLKGHLTKRTK